MSQISRETALFPKTVKRILYLGNALLRYILIYNLEVSFNFHLTFLQSNVIKMFTMQKKTVFFPPGYFLRAPDNSNLFRFPLKSDEGLFGTSRESTVFRTWTVQNNEEKDITKEKEKLEKKF